MLTAMGAERNPGVGLTVGLIALGTLLGLVALIYFSESANNLPGFLPGHTVGDPQRHIKHAILALALAVGCWVGAWLSSDWKVDTVDAGDSATS